jgi:uncharacterized protein with HEPN domain
MPRDFEVYLDDMREAIEKINIYAAGLSREQFARDDKTVDAVIRNLEISGEDGSGFHSRCASRNRMEKDLRVA